MAGDRCERCDRSECRADETARARAANEGPNWSADIVRAWWDAKQDCAAHAVDWRARALADRTDAERWRAIEPAISDVLDMVTGAIHAFESRGAGGQQVSYHGPFASITPGTLRDLKRIRDALGGDVPVRTTWAGPTDEEVRHHAVVSQKGAAAVRWQAKVEPLIEAVREAADPCVVPAHLATSLRALLAATKEGA